MKRLMDIVLSLGALVVFSPVLLVIAAMVRWKMGTPVIFRQERAGLHGKPFEILKFRSMRDARDEEGNPLSDAERMTPLGAMLRRTSIDELPGLWNVLKGDMSLVGPRPLLLEYLPLYSPEEARRHDVKPGVTGWAQVNGRNAISWKRKFVYDVWYVDNRSLKLDVKILLMTVRKLFHRHDISAEGEATVKKFTGREDE